MSAIQYAAIFGLAVGFALTILRRRHEWPSWGVACLVGVVLIGSAWISVALWLSQSPWFFAALVGVGFTLFVYGVGKLFLESLGIRA